jgi:hypothetical protein
VDTLDFSRSVPAQVMMGVLNTSETRCPRTIHFKVSAIA